MKTLGSIAVLVSALVLVAQAPAERPNAAASIQRGVITVGGRPLFPIMLLDQCARGAAGRAAALGINVIFNSGCEASASRQLSSLTHKQLGVLPIGGRAVQGTGLLGWTYPDEPDNNGWTPERLASAYSFRRGTADGLISFLTTTSAFYSSADRKGASARTAAFAAIADVAGFDLYPLNHCSSSLLEVYDAQRRFARLAPGKPTFQWIETGAIRPGYCGGLVVSPEQVTAEAWLAVAGGARGIGFFTHTWSPAHSEFAVTSAVQQAIRRFATSAAAIRPGLTGTTTDSTVSTPALRVLARVGGNRTYVIAVNTLPSVVPATISSAQLRATTMRVIGEGRHVKVYAGAFQDTFPPYGVKLYATP
jgi:hypothetical protein